MEDMELRWYRSRPSPAVYLHRRGAQVSREQMAESRGRTTFLGDHLARGEAVLGIHNATVYDNGTYPCLFRDGEPHSETTLALQVAGLGLEPRIHVTEDLDKGIRAECTSAGWYPEPHVEWRDFRGYAVPAVTRFSASATTGLLAVLSRVAVPDRSMGGLTCSISSPLLHERKVAESHLPGLPKPQSLGGPDAGPERAAVPPAGWDLSGTCPSCPASLPFGMCLIPLPAGAVVSTVTPGATPDPGATCTRQGLLGCKDRASLQGGRGPGLPGLERQGGDVCAQVS
ncbi:butyrophilin-like protein 10 isoform X6 [Oryctolagus cuniculus]